MCRSPACPDGNEPDSGEIDYAYLLNAVDELGYSGWIGCEYRPRAGTEAGLGLDRSTARAGSAEFEPCTS